MIRINKGREPREWTAKKATPGFTEFEPIPELRKALLDEQGYICAYCMRRIPTAKDDPQGPTSKIEHIKSQEDRPDLQLQYSNMAVCCPGKMDGVAHCDTLKLGNSVSFDLFGDGLESSISYSSKTGEIKSNNETWNNEMTKLLNLNHPLLKLNRENKLDGVIKALTISGWSKASVAAQIKKWTEFDNQGMREPFCGIVIWYLRKNVKQNRV